MAISDSDLELVRKEMENRGWRPDSRGEPDCFDQAAAMAAEAIKELQEQRAAQQQEVGRCSTCDRWLETRCPVCGPVNQS